MKTGDKQLGAWIPQFILLVFLFGPLIYLIGDSLFQLINEPSLLGFAFPVGRRFGLLINSLKLAATVSISVTLIGVLAGSKLVYEEGKEWSWIKWGFLLTAPVPPYIHALVWSGMVSNINQLLKGAGISFSGYGFGISCLVDTMAYLPLGVGLAMIGFMLVETPAVEAARLYKDNFRVFVEIVLPLASPMILAALGFVFILVITDYSIPTLYSYSVYSLEIFSEFSASNNPAHSVWLSIPLVLITLIVLTVSLRGLRNTVQSSSINREESLQYWSFPDWFNRLQLLAVTVIIVQVVFLIGGLLIETGSPVNMYYAVEAATDDLVTSAIIGFMGALLGGGLGYVLSLRLGKGGVWWVLVSLPLALPSAIVGIGLIDVYNSWFPWLYGTMAMPVIAVTTRFVAIATIIIYTQSKRVDPLLFEAAELFKREQNQDLWQVKLPLQKYGLAAAVAALMAFSVGELGSTLLVVPPGRETITIRIFNYLHYGGSEEVAGLCLLIVVLMMTLTGIAFKAYGGKTD
jgi:iron(III) transport system permease protein